jgi:hypothetical protein
MMKRLSATLAVSLLALGCASAGLNPGTGDISFRISWSGIADLDLYAVSPLGERLSFIRKESDSGGVLDIDCNARPDPTIEGSEEIVWLCPKPMENIFWPRGDAPEGTYKYWIVLADTEGLQADDEYRLEVRLGKQVIRSHFGKVAELGEQPVNAEIDYQRE